MTSPEKFEKEHAAHLVGLLGKPSALRDYERIAMCVRAGCSDTSTYEWADPKCKSVVRYLKHLLIEQATAIAPITKDAGGKVSLTFTETRNCRPIQGSRNLIKPFKEACDLLEESLDQLPVPGDNLRAIALLFGAVADLEFASAMPLGTPRPMLPALDSDPIHQLENQRKSYERKQATNR
jgi:hypothetical protein